MNFIKGNSYSVEIRKINDTGKLYEEFGQIEQIETPLQSDTYWLLECSLRSPTLHFAEFRKAEPSAYSKNSSVEETIVWRKVIAQNSAELPPVLLLMEKNSKVFVGAYTILLTLELKTGRVLFKTDLLQGTFLFFHPSEENSLVAAICEFEIYTFDSSGTLVWKLDLPEVIQDVLQVDDTLEIRDLSDQIYRFNINSGLKMRSEQTTPI
jgi:hypothetical protein